MVALLSALLLCGSTGVTQADDPRARTLLRGRIVTTEGPLWPQAEVHLMARPWDDAPPVDTQVVPVDANGSFEARLIADLVYAAYAVGPAANDGSYRSTGIASCQGGSRVELTETKGGNLRRRVRLPTSVDPKQVVVVVDETWPPIELRPDEQRDVLLPPRPGRYAKLALRRAEDRRDLLTRSIAISKQACTSALERHRKLVEAHDAKRAKDDVSATEATKNDSDGESATNSAETSDDDKLDRARRALAEGLAFEDWSLPNTNITTVLVRVTADGKPVAGVHVKSTYGSTGMARASDENGWLRIPIHVQTQPGNWHVAQNELHLDGYRPSLFDFLFTTKAKNGAKQQPIANGGIEIEEGRDIDALIRAGTPDMTAKLARGVTMTGRIVVGGKPIAGLELRASTRPDKSNSSQNFSRGNTATEAIRTRTDAQGAFSFFGLEPGGPFLVEALFDASIATALGEPSVHSTGMIASGTTNATEHDVGTIDLALLPRQALRVLRSDGQAARFAEVVLARGDPMFFVRTRCDRAGRTTVVLPELADFDVASGHESESMAGTLRATGTTACVLRLEAPIFIQGVVRNEKNEPLPGAYVNVWTWKQNNDQSLRDRITIPTQATADAEGRYRLALRRQESAMFGLNAYVRQGNKTISMPNSQQQPFPEEDVTIDIEIPGASPPKPTATVNGESANPAKY